MTSQPEIPEILAVAKRRLIRRVMLNTNGIRIAEARDFVARLAEFRPGSRSRCSSIH